jgi:iron complex outermembrane receptor protein
MKTNLTTLLVILNCVFASFSIAQTARVSGQVLDGVTGETLPMAVLSWGSNPGQSATSDLDGNFDLALPLGEYMLKVNSVGYIEYSIKLNVDRLAINLKIELTNKMLKEIVVTSDYVIGRDVPVAVSNIPLKQVEEELAGREIATLANSTPGTYATRSGGGDGDARVTIRGFSQNNVAVMLDGVPVNDMENGAVYWSNWFGLDMVMQTTQIQRGLGASKLVIPAVGGTMNIITRGIEQEKRGRVRYDYADGAFSRISFGLSSGRLKNDWSFSLAGSFKQGSGWVDGTHTKGFFWYGKVEKIIGKHVLSFYGFGAPQEHGQRSRPDAVAMYDPALAAELGAETDGIPNRGTGYNPHVGNLTRYDFENGIRSNETTFERFNERKNYYHKPQFALKDVWNINERSFLSTVAYLSIGNGGGTRLNSFPTKASYLENGDLDFQSIYDLNSGYSPPLFSGPDYNINTAISPVDRYAYNFINSSINNHFWYGVISTYNKNVSENVDVSMGVDLRRYRGEHYRTVYDLFGADYIVASSSYDNNDPNLVKRKGDKIDYHNDAFVQWGGLFGQVEYKKNKWKSFASLSVARTGYRRVDYFLPKVIEVDGEQIAVGYELIGNTHILTPDTVVHNGQIYTPESEGLEFQNTGWTWRNTFTVKTGVKYEISRSSGVFVNVGYLDKAPLFNQVYNTANELLNNIENEKIRSAEAGWNFQHKVVAANVNVYYTKWKNKPYTNGLNVPNPIDPTETISTNVQGMGARHMGVELDFALKVTKKLTIEGLMSIGDWIWTTGDTLDIFDDNGNRVFNLNGTPYTVAYDAKGVHVNDAAQIQWGGMIRYDITKSSYIKTRYTWFDKNYARFDPFSLNGANAGRDSWQLPSYGSLELHLGGSFKVKTVQIEVRGSVFNLLNDRFITDAFNNDANGLYNQDDNGFDVNSATVHFGQPRWFNLSTTITF